MLLTEKKYTMFHNIMKSYSGLLNQSFYFIYLMINLKAGVEYNRRWIALYYIGTKQPIT